MIKGFNYRCIRSMLNKSTFKHENLLDNRLPTEPKERYYRAVYNDEPTSKLDYWNERWRECLYSEEHDATELWCEIIKDAPSECITEMAAKIISAIVNLRVGSDSGATRCSVYPRSPKQKSSGLYTFQDIWGTTDLLTGMWFSFYLKITGKLQQEYKICPVCELPIIAEDGGKLRLNTIYHPGCRQTGHNRKRREVEKLWKEGMSINEIIAITEIKEEQIIKWISKLNPEKI